LYDRRIFTSSGVVKEMTKYRVCTELLGNCLEEYSQFFESGNYPGEL
jgi:hypothetical protein